MNKDMRNFTYSKKQKGISIIEVLVYIAILSLVLVTLVQGIVQLSRVYTFARNERKVSNVAKTTLERIVREMRLACSSDSWPVAGNTLTLRTFPDFGAGVTAQTCGSTQKVFHLDSGHVTMDVVTSGVSASQIISPTNGGVNVTTIQFLSVNNASSFAGSQAIRVTLTAEAGKDNYKVTRTYYATAILRQSY